MTPVPKVMTMEFFLELLKEENRHIEGLFSAKAFETGLGATLINAAIQRKAALLEAWNDQFERNKIK